MAATVSSSGRFLHSGLAFAAGVAALLGLMVLPRLVPHGGGMVGKPAPALTLSVAANGIAGTQMSLADLKGKPVLLDFWASWCGPCAMEAPIVDRLARRYGQKGLVVMGVNVDDSPDVIRAYAEKKGLSYPMVVDVGKRASMTYGVDKLPSLVLIDKQGNVKSFMTGLVDEASLDEAIGAAM
jgi:thiol-disulfide isomerase/thioredoxin